MLIGFLTGVGIQVAFGQIGGMLGIPEGPGSPSSQVRETVTDAAYQTRVRPCRSAGVMATILGMVHHQADPGRADRGDRRHLHQLEVGPRRPRGHPRHRSPAASRRSACPTSSWSDVPALMGTAVSVFVLILAQSAATSRAYAAKYDDEFDENVDLVGLGSPTSRPGSRGRS